MADPPLLNSGADPIPGTLETIRLLRLGRLTWTRSSAGLVEAVAMAPVGVHSIGEGLMWIHIATSSDRLQDSGQGRVHIRVLADHVQLTEGNQVLWLDLAMAWTRAGIRSGVRSWVPVPDNFMS